MSEKCQPLAGKIAIVVGAAGGIGSSIARRFAEAGAKVACVDRLPPEVVAKAISDQGGEAVAIGCDITRPDETRKAAEQVKALWNRTDVLVNSASADDPTASILDLPPETWNHIFAVNVTGPYLMSRAVLPLMIAGGGGAIIHVASQLGHVGSAGRPAYCATKGALIQLTKAMAADHAAHGIRVNSLSPGAVETRRMVLRHGDMENARKVSGPKHLLGRLGQPDEIATAAVFLASPAASFMTGTDLLVDGGYIAI
jgi:NAD(P)-dependent dehydrogenase (short-subunit alcohol dehydrogenase family)